MTDNLTEATLSDHVLKSFRAFGRKLGDDYVYMDDVRLCGDDFVLAADKIEGLTDQNDCLLKFYRQPHNHACVCCNCERLKAMFGEMNSGVIDLRGTRCPLCKENIAATPHDVAWKLGHDGIPELIINCRNKSPLTLNFTVDASPFVDIQEGDNMQPNTGVVWNPGARVTDGSRQGEIVATSPEKGLEIKWDGDENAAATWHDLDTIQHV